MQQREMIVLTGGPCSGKTKMIEEIRRRGFNVVPESAREVIRREGFEKNETEKMQLEIFRIQLERENSISAGVSFLDRSIVDVRAYTQFLLGRVPAQLAEFPTNGRYAFVFLIAQLPFEADGERIESDASEAKKMHELIQDEYKKLSYDLIEVPVFSGSLQESVGRRVDYVFEVLGRKNYGLH